ncbi:MerR family DNA-binding protein [Streptomyces avidinii]|uniref:MerR family DNA-binding protein n=1 Tax=Streptomyces avidinii TaxID=1895 RepID=UPI0037B0E9F3
MRFYESAGLLPAERTASGYRVYGEDAVERLAFISSAKLLGLALEEIRDLLEVREEGVCSSVRARILPLVAARLRDTDSRVAELRAFSERLSGVRAALSGPAPEGACGPDCGCGPAAAQATGAEPVALPLGDREASRAAPVACTLDAAELGRRTGQWRALVTLAARREDIEDGLRLHFPPDAALAGRIAALAAAEQGCCAFFGFTLHLTPAALRLDVSAPESAAGMLAGLFGASASSPVADPVA